MNASNLQTVATVEKHYQNIINEKMKDFQTRKNRLKKINNKLKTLDILLFVIILVVIVDVLGFLMWTLSGQTPVDGFFLGNITNLIFNIL